MVILGEGGKLGKDSKLWPKMFISFLCSLYASTRDVVSKCSAGCEFFSVKPTSEFLNGNGHEVVSTGLILVLHLAGS